MGLCSLHSASNLLLLAAALQCEEVAFVDVREQWEYDTAKLPHFKLFPLSQASSWAANIEDQLDPDTETVVLCHHGMRSMQMAGVRATAAV